MNTFKQILVPTDFSETAGAALECAKSIADRFGGSLHVLHVLQDPVLYGPVVEGYTVLATLREDMYRDAKRHLGQLLDEAERQALNARMDLTWGHPADVIVDYAAQNRIDLVVMGTHGRGPLTRLLLGSVADKVVRKAPCAVMTVRPRQHAAGPH
jgi:nucleotide-binding universal stress UspA family protein